MPNYYEKLLDIANQQGYRLPETQVFSALEVFKEQCNQVLAYRHMSVHFRYFRDQEQPECDGGYIALYGENHAFLGYVAMWTYAHPFHTFPISLKFDEQEFVCQTADDVEIALNALLDSANFQRYFAA